MGSAWGTLPELKVTCELSIITLFTGKYPLNVCLSVCSVSGHFIQLCWKIPYYAKKQVEGDASFS